MNYKRFVAVRKHINGCDYCSKNFMKGDVYYVKHHVFKDDQQITSYKEKVCAKCKSYADRRKKRFEDFKLNCIHPEKCVYTEYTYIPGECVKEPNCDCCSICGARF